MKHTRQQVTVTVKSLGNTSSLIYSPSPSSQIHRAIGYPRPLESQDVNNDAMIADGNAVGSNATDRALLDFILGVKRAQAVR